jgi:hypothetical protein
MITLSKEYRSKRLNDYFCQLDDKSLRKLSDYFGLAEFDEEQSHKELLRDVKSTLAYIAETDDETTELIDIYQKIFGITDDIFAGNITD